MEGVTTLSVVIPTLGREDVLLSTIRSLLPQMQNHELIVVDQTRAHQVTTSEQLQSWSDGGAIKWIQLKEPSVPAAMNRGLRDAQGQLVVFLDDDIAPPRDLLASHLAAHRERHEDDHESRTVALVAGRVIQPWHQTELADAPFLWPEPREVTAFMGGNFSIIRRVALDLGGFDENFRYAAYCYERDFADRLLAAGYRIAYEPRVFLHHLKAVEGGVRVYGDHLTTMKPGHALGAYYYILKSGQSPLKRVATRLFGSFATRFHLRRPWYIPLTLFAELRGLLEAIRAFRNGPRLMDAAG